MNIDTTLSEIVECLRPIGMYRLILFGSHADHTNAIAAKSGWIGLLAGRKATLQSRLPVCLASNGDSGESPSVRSNCILRQ